MRFISFSLICALFVSLGSGCATSSQQAKLAADIQQLRTEVESLKTNVKAVQKTSSSFSFPSGSIASSPSMDKITKIKFPDNPSSENLKNYINEILVASQGQRTSSSQDPQGAMLARVGSDNIQLLIDAVPAGGSSFGGGGYYLESAIKMLVEERHQSQILKALPTKQRLASIVTQMHWEKEARDILLAELRGANGAYLPTEWITAIACLEDPETYDALADYLTKTQNPSQVYQSIYRLPGIKLDEAVKEAWKRSKYYPSDYMVTSMAPIAASFGNQDALDVLINQLKNPPGNPFSSSSNPRTALLTLLDITGSNEEIIAWYEANKNNLVFDPASKKFRLKK